MFKIIHRCLTLLCWLPLPLLAALPQPPGAAANAAEMARYYQSLADHYQSLADHYKLLVATEKNTASLPDIDNMLKRQQAALKQNKATPAEVSAFAGSYAALGFVMNTGDTNSWALNSKALVNYQPNEFSVSTLNLSYQNFYNSSEGGVSTNRFYSDLNSAYNFNEVRGIYGDINYTRDTSSGYEYMANESVGYNRILQKTPKWNLTLQVGPGLLQRKLRATPYTFENNVTGNLKLNSKYGITEALNWQETYNLISTEGDMFHSLDSNITTTLWDEFALQLDYLVTYETEPPTGKAKINTITTLSLVYNFN